MFIRLIDCCFAARFRSVSLITFWGHMTFPCDISFLTLTVDLMNVEEQIFFLFVCLKLSEFDSLCVVVLVCLSAKLGVFDNPK
eukprot:m.53237 g.53237  ORF g.53237 m.53237 type:complete len:83 (+) comp12774_c0_seq1:1510-1758(+)